MPPRVKIDNVVGNPVAGDDHGDRKPRSGVVVLQSVGVRKARASGVRHRSRGSYGDGDVDVDGGPKNHHRKLKVVRLAPRAMGLASPAWSWTSSGLLKSCAASPISSQRVCAQSSEGELFQQWTVRPGRGCFQSFAELVSVESLKSSRNGIDSFLRVRSLRLLGGGLTSRRGAIGGGVSGWHSGGGCCKVGLQLRFASRSDLTDTKCWPSVQSQGQRIPCNLSRRWHIHKSRVRCAASREEDGGRQQRRYSQEVDVVDHYKVLGLRRQATASAIKLAYRQLARQLHPDVNKDADANEKFMSVRLAYDVLSDETSRKSYDSTLQEQVKMSRRKQVYQRRERDTWLRNRSRYRRAPSENSEWGYSVYSYENEYSNMESYYYTYPGSGTFSNKKKNSSRNSNRGKSPKEDIRQQDWQVALQNIGKEALFFLWVVSAMWHAFGAQMALGLLVSSLALWKDFAVGYRLASGVAWLMGGEKGLALMVALIVTTRVFGKTYHGIAAIVALALWLGGGVLRAVPLPHGAILVLVYKCIQLQSEYSL